MDRVQTIDGDVATVVEFDNEGARTVMVRLDQGPQAWYRPEDLTKITG
jgi:hypothetical protein